MEPKTPKEHYLAKIAGEDVTIPKPKTPQEHYLKKIAENGVVGASSLADLSDVEIDPIGQPFGNLLRFDDNNGKWENVSPAAALFGRSANADQGVIYFDDAGSFQTSSAILIANNTDAGRALSQLVDAAINFGQYQLDGLDRSKAAMLLTTALKSAMCNIPCYLGLISLVGIQWAIPLTVASIEGAAWSGNFFTGDKLFRLTIFIYMRDNAESATIMAKTEQLMTYTEPT